MGYQLSYHSYNLRIDLHLQEHNAATEHICGEYACTMPLSNISMVLEYACTMPLSNISMVLEYACTMPLLNINVVLEYACTMPLSNIFVGNMHAQCRYQTYLWGICMHNATIEHNCGEYAYAMPLLNIYVVKMHDTMPLSNISMVLEYACTMPLPNIFVVKYGEYVMS